MFHGADSVRGFEKFIRLRSPDLIGAPFFIVVNLKPRFLA